MDTFRIGERLTLELSTDGEQSLVIGAVVADQTGATVELVFDDQPHRAVPSGVGLRLSAGHERGCLIVGGVLLGDLSESAVHARVGLAGEGRYLQRREAFRVRCNVPVRFAPSPAPEMAALRTISGELTRGTTCDLSSTGIRFYSPVAIAERAIVHLELGIDGAPLVTKATVLRVERLPQGFTLGGRFVRLSRQDDARLARFILETETRNRLR